VGQADFDLFAVYEAIDKRRRERKLSWTSVAKEVNRFRLPNLTTGQILSWDISKLFLALNAQRVERQLTWSGVAREIRGFTPGMLTNLSKGGRIGFPRLMRLVQ